MNVLPSSVFIYNGAITQRFNKSLRSSMLSSTKSNRTKASRRPHTLYFLFKVNDLDNITMFTNDKRQKERTGRYGTPRLQYLQELVTQFQNATNEETKERVVANLANFAYDPYNYTFLRQLNVLELFLDCITEPNEKLVEFGIGGVCNSCAEPENAAIIIQHGGIPLAIQCLSSPVKNTVNSALGSLYYLCNNSNRGEVLKPEVIDLINRYATAEATSVSFSNLARAFLEKHVFESI
ncbi:hypothetical protein G4B88_028180 [Cannabis sativa]|uniref:Armadillo repeat-containing protein 7 n=2 Tax=Cannabis sativa TaxID=3483 RepID=A0A7J6HU58_CANSA|nr:hypothetical protein G4B88_028180 [Cannabis sativa]